MSTEAAGPVARMPARMPIPVRVLVRCAAAVAAVSVAGVAVGCMGWEGPDRNGSDRKGSAQMESGNGGKSRKADRVSAREGRDRAVELVVSTTKLLDVTGWWTRNGAAWATECTLDGEMGASYNYSQWAPRGSDHVGDAERVAEYWESLGMRVRIVSQGGPVVYGEGGPVLRASFDTNAAANSYRVGAIAPCSPGESDEQLNDEDHAARERGEVLPGDEGLVPLDDPRRKANPAHPLS